MSKLINLKGRRFGKWTVLEVSDRSHRGNKYWTSRCDCGTIKDVLGTTMRRGSSTSCGCNHHIKGKKHNLFRGYEGLSGNHWNRITGGAKLRGIPVTITTQQAWEIYESQAGVCALSGIPIAFPVDVYDKTWTASLDRIDSSKGYEVGNVQWVHKKINIMKNRFSDSEFIDLCLSVVNYSV